MTAKQFCEKYAVSITHLPTFREEWPLSDSWVVVLKFCKLPEMAAYTTHFSKGIGHRTYKTSGERSGGRFYFWSALANYRKGQNIKIASRWKVTPELLDIVRADTNPTPPTPEEVIESLASDVGCVLHRPSHADFCAEFGYDIDSIKGRDTYDAIMGIHDNLQRIMRGKVLTAGGPSMWDDFTGIREE